jgi:hypothetical protein
MNMGRGLKKRNGRIDGKGIDREYSICIIYNNSIIIVYNNSNI